MERAQILEVTAKRNPFKETAYPSHLISMQLLIKLLLHYQDHLADLNKSIEALAEELLEYDLIQSIRGIGTKIAATILAEIGEIDRFGTLNGIAIFNQFKFKANSHLVTLQFYEQPAS
ncbi:transposase [Paenibacillus sp. SI8]|uniref:transposase n=1 Tax=unclassified Paenibacillus TaxID=185978 RepID=UPI003467504E